MFKNEWIMPRRKELLPRRTIDYEFISVTGHLQ